MVKASVHAGELMGTLTLCLVYRFKMLVYFQTSERMDCRKSIHLPCAVGMQPEPGLETVAEQMLKLQYPLKYLMIILIVINHAWPG
jgi:hypothetical protein